MIIHVPVSTFGLPVASLLAKRLIAIMGQSNAAGRKFIEQVSQPQHDILIAPYPRVTIRRWESTNATPPVLLYDTSNGTGTDFPNFFDEPLQPRPYALPDPNMGFELSMGHYIDGTVPNGFNIVQFAVGATGLAVTGAGVAGEWHPQLSKWPTVGNNLAHQGCAYLSQAEADGLGTMGCVVWDQGEQDALDFTAGSNYGPALANLIAFQRAYKKGWENTPWVIVRLSSAFAPSGNPGFRDLVRAGQEWVAANVPNVWLVDSDGILLDSGIHFTPDGYVTLGYRIGPYVIRACGIVMPPAALWTYQSGSLLVNMTDLSTDPNINGSVTGRLWTFGDGSSSRDRNPVHVYQVPGSYDVTLTATDNYGSSSCLTQRITVAAPTWPTDGKSGIGVPMTLSEWQAIVAAHSLAVGPPAHSYPLQEPSGNALDSIGSINLLPVNNPARQVVVAGWNRFAVGANGLAQTQNFNNITFADVASTRVLTLGYGIYNTTATNRAQLARGGSGVNELEVAGGTNKMRYRLGGVGVNSVNDHAGAVRPFAVYYDPITQVAKLYSDLEVVSTAWTAQSGKVLTLTTGLSSDAAAFTNWLCAWDWILPAAITDQDVRDLLRALAWFVTF